MKHLNYLASLDGFMNPNEPIFYHFNTDKNCRKQHSIDKRYGVVLNIHKESKPVLEEGDSELMKVSELIPWISAAISNAHMQWGERPNNLLKHYDFSVLTFMLPEINANKIYENKLAQ